MRGSLKPQFCVLGDARCPKGTSLLCSSEVMFLSSMKLEVVSPAHFELNSLTLAVSWEMIAARCPTDRALCAHCWRDCHAKHRDSVGTVVGIGNTVSRRLIWKQNSLIFTSPSVWRTKCWNSSRGFVLRIKTHSLFMVVPL